ncbi:MAG: response regulator [Planctomycetes bacterium]|nr:response regulator [Planctomycetota bacterium]
MSKRVLICDDEADIVGIIGAYFESLGFSPSVESSPLKAIERIRQEDFNLITFDYMMPELNGVAAIHQMLAIKPGLKFLLITGLDEGDARLQSIRDCGLQASLLFKPFLMRDLVGALKRLGV